jgi:multidrug efflux pump subunit AcrA (membrane-fusion protein)
MTEGLNIHAADTAVDGSASQPTVASLGDRVRSLRIPQTQQPPKSGRSWLPWVLCVGLTGAIAWLGYLNYDLRQERQNDREVAKNAAEVTKTAAGKQRELGPGEILLENKGYVIAVHPIQVSPKVWGMVTRLYFKEGDIVAKGQLLVEIEDVNYRADRDRARGTFDEARCNLDLLTKYRTKEIEQARSKLDEARAQVVQLESDYRRGARLRQTESMTAVDYEKARSSFFALKERCTQLQIDYELLKQGPRDINIQGAQARICQAKADLDRAQWYLDNCKIVAPIAGTILSKNAEENNIVNTLSYNLKASVCDIADLSDVEAVLTIQERDVAKVYKNQRCRIRSEAFPNRIYNGFVSRLMPMGDRAKGAVPVRVKVEVPPEEQGQYLKPDMGVIVSFFKDEKKDGRAETKN